MSCASAGCPTPSSRSRGRISGAASAEQADAEAGARVLGLETVAFNARNAREIGLALAEIQRAKVDSLLVRLTQSSSISASRLYRLPAGNYSPRCISFVNSRWPPELW